MDYTRKRLQIPPKAFTDAFGEPPLYSIHCTPRHRNGQQRACTASPLSSVVSPSCHLAPPSGLSHHHSIVVTAPPCSLTHVEQKKKNTEQPLPNLGGIKSRLTRTTQYYAGTVRGSRSSLSQCATCHVAVLYLSTSSCVCSSSLSPTKPHAPWRPPLRRQRGVEHQGRRQHGGSCRRSCFDGVVDAIRPRAPIPAPPSPFAPVSSPPAPARGEARRSPSPPHSYRSE